MMLRTLLLCIFILTQTIHHSTAADSTQSTSTTVAAVTSDSQSSNQAPSPTPTAVNPSSPSFAASHRLSSSAFPDKTPLPRLHASHLDADGKRSPSPFPQTRTKERPKEVREAERKRDIERYWMLKHRQEKMIEEKRKAAEQRAAELRAKGEEDAAVAIELDAQQQIESEQRSKLNDFDPFTAEFLQQAESTLAHVMSNDEPLMFHYKSLLRRAKAALGAEKYDLSATLFKEASNLYFDELKRPYARVASARALGETIEAKMEKAIKEEREAQGMGMGMDGDGDASSPAAGLTPAQQFRSKEVANHHHVHQAFLEFKKNMEQQGRKAAAGKAKKTNNVKPTQKQKQGIPISKGNDKNADKRSG